MKQSSKIVFFGSGPVARETLEGLLPHFCIEAIITKPRAENHRGSVPVLEFAQEHDIPFFTPTNKSELSELFTRKRFESQAGLVVDYGIIIAKSVIDSFPKGIVNSHFSLLPEWRGADPITFAILSGQSITGVSLMLINEKLDEGELLAQQELSLPVDITTPELTHELVKRSNTMLVDILPKYLMGSIKPYPQSGSTASYSRKLTKEDGQLDTSKSATQLEREIRAFTGWPKSHITIFGKDIIVKKARVARSQDDGELVIPCGDKEPSFLEITSLIAPSGRTMSGADFVRGYKK